MLEELGCKVIYKVNTDGEEEVTVEVAGEKIPWRRYLEEYVNDNQHEMIRKNVLLATRNFQHRVEMFRKKVLFGDDNPMKICHISYRVEFQGRGAGHIHGVFWVDLKNVKVDGMEQGDLQSAFKTMSERQPVTAEEKKALEQFTDEFVTCSKNPQVAGKKAVKIAKEVNWHGHSQSCRKKSAQGKCRFNFPKYPLQKTEFIDANKEYEEGEKLTEKRRTNILKRVRKVLLEEVNGKMVVSKAVEKIMEEKTTEEGIGGRIIKVLELASNVPDDEEEEEEEDASGPMGTWEFEKYKVQRYRELRQKTSKMTPERKKKEKLKLYEELKKKYEKVKERMDRKKWKKIEIKDYLDAVHQQPRKGSTVLLKRDIDEIFMNNYNPEMITAWDANMDLQPTFDYYAVITYIVDYFTKTDETQQTILRQAMKQLPKDQDARKRCNDLANLFLTHRQVGEAEAYYKLFPHMNLIYSDVATVFVPTDARGERSHFLQKQDPKDKKGFAVKDKNGLFLEKQDLVSKYERRKVIESEEDQVANDVLEELTFCQFVKMYQSRSYSKWTEEDRNEEECGGQANFGPTNEDQEGELSEEDNFNLLISGKDELRDLWYPYQRKKRLPEVITLSNLHAGEPPMLHKRKFPRAIRYFKRNEDQHGHKFYLAELMLYVPFRDENELYPDDEDKCRKLYEERKDEIQLARAQLMPYQRTAENARMSYEQVKEVAGDEEEVGEEVGAELDPEKEQEVADGEEEGEEDHPDYLHIDPDQVEEQPEDKQAKKRVCRTIEIPSKDAQVEEARKLDKMQKYVLSLGLQYAKGVRKAENQGTERKGKQRTKAPTPPLVMVHGGAGSGKSSVIHTLAPMVADILQQPGDDPECPYVVLTAAFGSAAANINGGTLHHTFGFKFGDDYFPLADKQREEKMCQFRNLRFVIVDEISLVSADFLYVLDLRLREIKSRKNTPMGGVAVFVFGDLYQLQPVKGRYVFEKPKNKHHAISYELRNLWQMFEVVNLEENHRQGEDKEYADLLNRVRVGEFTEEDIDVLKSRVRKEDSKEIKERSDDLHIYSTNKKVNARNKSKLEERQGKEFTVKAGNSSRMIRNFKPAVNNAGCILNTPFQAVLKVKKGVEVILVWNVDVADGLANGSRGVLVGVEMKKKEGQEAATVKRMMVRFHNKKHGEERRASFPCHKYPEATYIEPYTHQYHLHGSIATVQQFPLRMAAGMTAHKVQGQTITKPNCLVIDMRGYFKPGMVYVMLSRVCNIKQLFILDEVNTVKIKASSEVRTECVRMELVSVNRNPTPWNDRRVEGTRVSSLNVRSLRKHMEDVRTDHFLKMSDIICLQETWLEEEESDQNRYQLEGYKSFFNCQGRGKGVATYVRGEKFKHECDVTTPLLQMTKLSSNSLDVINVYRSQGHPFPTAVQHLEDLVNIEKTTLIIGDFNFCFTDSGNNLSKHLARMKFKQLITTATHIGGNILDQAHLRSTRQEVSSVVETIAEYYTDHDLVTVLLQVTLAHSSKPYIIFFLVSQQEIKSCYDVILSYLVLIV